MLYLISVSTKSARGVKRDRASSSNTHYQSSSILTMRVLANRNNGPSVPRHAKDVATCQKNVEIGRGHQGYV
jgi:hypothetical protein